MTGNALLSTFNQASFVVGPALAGGLTAWAGPGWVIAVDAASFAVLAVICRRAGGPGPTVTAFRASGPGAGQRGGRAEHP